MKIELSRDEHLIIMDSLLHTYSEVKEHTEDDESELEIIDPEELARLYIKLLNY